jgi:hypothetical protein
VLNDVIFQFFHRTGEHLLAKNTRLGRALLWIRNIVKFAGVLAHETFKIWDASSHLHAASARDKWSGTFFEPYHSNIADPLNRPESSAVQFYVGYVEGFVIDNTLFDLIDYFRLSQRGRLQARFAEPFCVDPNVLMPHCP